MGEKMEGKRQVSHKAPRTEGAEDKRKGTEERKRRNLNKEIILN
jgi:hypothetical protein